LRLNAAGVLLGRRGSDVHFLQAQRVYKHAFAALREK